jgi:SAM-dependent methyltransferase
MYLPSGIPTLSDLEKLKSTEMYGRHVRFNRDFLARHGPAMAKYGQHWGLDPYKLWSRRWEYPFAAQRLVNFAEKRPPGEFTVLDAGSGVTYFPYFILEHLPQAQFVCCDYDGSYAQMFDEINRDRGQPNVRFVRAMLQKLPLPDASLDAVCCISVLEHTDNYGDIIKEFARVLKPDGAFVLTFDLSLDGKFTLPKDMAAKLLELAGERFQFPQGFEPQRELERMSEPGILNTDYIRDKEPDLLPWSKPVRVYKAMQDLIRGRGWTTGFRSRTIYCVDLARK